MQEREHEGQLTPCQCVRDFTRSGRAPRKDNDRNQPRQLGQPAATEETGLWSAPCRPTHKPVGPKSSPQLPPDGQGGSKANQSDPSVPKGETAATQLWGEAGVQHGHREGRDLQDSTAQDKAGKTLHRTQARRLNKTQRTWPTWATPGPQPPCRRRPGRNGPADHRETGPGHTTRCQSSSRRAE